MIENLAWKFLPPYEFYFRVCFMERLVSLFYASFTEVSGLGWNYEKQTQTGAENTAQELPKAIKIWQNNFEITACAFGCTV